MGKEGKTIDRRLNWTVGRWKSWQVLADAVSISGPLKFLQHFSPGIALDNTCRRRFAATTQTLCLCSGNAMYDDLVPP